MTSNKLFLEFLRSLRIFLDYTSSLKAFFKICLKLLTIIRVHKLNGLEWMN